MKNILRVGYYLSIAYYDIQFRLFFIIMVLKLFLFTHITKLGAMSFFPSFGILLMVLALSLFVKGRFSKFIYLLISDFVFSIIFFSHSLYHAFFGRFISLYFINQIHQLPAVVYPIISMIGYKYLFLIDLLVMPLIYYKAKFNYGYRQCDIRKTVLALMALGLYCNIYVGYFAIMFSKNHSQSAYSRPGLATVTGIINYQIIDIYNYALTDEKEKASSVDINHVLDWRNNHNKSVEHNELTGLGKGLNLIAIQVESLQNFVINKRYNGYEITPNLNRLLNEGIYFSNCFDQIDAGGSSDATFLANCSLYPSRRGAVSFFYPRNTFDSLPKILGENGYSSALMHNYDERLWNFEALGKAIGFMDQHYEDSFLRNDMLGGRVSDHSFFLQSVAKIKELPVPFYAYLITYTSHEPFTHVTKEIDNFPLGALEGKRIGHYIRSMHYVDSAIGEFLHKLSEHNLRSNTVIVFYGDHRARLTDKELQSSGVKDMSESNKIPLIITCPNRTKMDIRDTIGGLLDLTPTVCNILGIDISDKFFIGKDLGHRKKDFVVFRNGSFISRNGTMDRTSAQEQLMVSDLIIEKDMIPLIRGKLTTQRAAID